MILRRVYSCHLFLQLFDLSSLDLNALLQLLVPLSDRHRKHEIHVVFYSFSLKFKHVPSSFQADVAEFDCNLKMLSAFLFLSPVINSSVLHFWILTNAF